MTMQDLEKMAPKLRVRMMALSGKADSAKTTEKISDIAYDITIILQEVFMLIEKSKK